MINKTNNTNCKFEKNKQPDRNANYDLLRITATIAVIAIHVNWLYFAGSYEVYSGDISWIIQSLINIITRFSVPCFVMISGAYNLNNEANAGIKYFYKKTAFRIFLPFAAVLLLEVIATILMNLVLHRDINSELNGIFTTGIYNSWYMYMLLGLYLLTPFIVKLKTLLSWNTYRLFAVLMLVWAVISQSTSTQKMAYSMGVVVAFLGYYLIGDVIRSEMSKRAVESKKKIILCSLIISLFAVGATFWARAMGINYYIENWSINFFSPTIVLYSISVFSVFSVIGMKAGAGLYWLSKRTYFIYLFHTMILIVLHYIVKLKIGNELLAIALLIISTFALSLLSSLCFEKAWNFICMKFSIEEKWKHI
jgi:surface polysaccharide O-acyltransferase-like enzyme